MYVFLCKNFKCLLKSSGFIKLTSFLENSCSNCWFLLDVFLSMYFGTLVCRHNFEWKVLGICFCGFFSLSSFSMLLSLFSGFVVDSLRCHWPSTEPRQAQSFTETVLERLQIQPASQRASWCTGLHQQDFPSSETSLNHSFWQRFQPLFVSAEAHPIFSFQGSLNSVPCLSNCFFVPIVLQKLNLQLQPRAQQAHSFSAALRIQASSVSWGLFMRVFILFSNLAMSFLFSQYTCLAQKGLLKRELIEPFWQKSFITFIFKNKNKTIYFSFKVTYSF